MPRILSMLVAALVLLSLVACKNTPPAEPSAAAEPASPEASAPAAKTVEVSAEGNEFSPAIEKGQLPANVYYCDMGTVHYARSVKGDNRCPLCKMFLTFNGTEEPKAAEAAPAAAPHAHDGAEGHDHAHGEGGHTH